MTRVLVLYYSSYGHIERMAEAVAEGVREGGAHAEIKRVPELVRAFEERRWPLPRTLDRVYDPARAIRELGWRPRYGFSEVLRMVDEEHAEVLPPRRG